MLNKLTIRRYSVALSRPGLLVKPFLSKEISIFCNSLAETTAIKSWQSLSEEQLWHEACLCILSSNVPYELARSAHTHLKKLGISDYEWILENEEAVDILAAELSKPYFSPLKKDGTGRRYRFPNVRAHNIAEAALSIYGEGKTLQTLLSDFESAEAAREYLVSNVSGLGLKEASHLLRNIGYSFSLAIIDVHILSFLRQFGVINEAIKPPITPKVYFELESLMQSIAEHMKMSLGILDNAIWNYMKSKNRP